MTPKRGEIYLVGFDPAQGAEIKKTRPALVVQNNVGNRYGNTVIVAAISSHKEERRLYPVDVQITRPEGGLQVDSVILLDQIRAVDKSRLLKKLGKCSPSTMTRVDRALLISLGIIKL